MYVKYILGVKLNMMNCPCLEKSNVSTVLCKSFFITYIYIYIYSEKICLSTFAFDNATNRLPSTQAMLIIINAAGVLCLGNNLLFGNTYLFQEAINFTILIKNAIQFPNFDKSL